MAKFITGTELEKAICDIIWEAKQKLLIVSPFIKLDDFFKKHFERHNANYDLHLLIVFGKNENDVSKSLNQGDFEFFKSFPNVSIIYEPKLHAKYYGNEAKGVITSINLYDASFKSNIEFGIFTQLNLITQFASTTEKDAWEKCNEIAGNGEVVFIRRPIFKKVLLVGKKYLTSKTLLDNTEYFYTQYGKRQLQGKKLADFDEFLYNEEAEAVRPTREVYNRSASYEHKVVNSNNLVREEGNSYSIKNNKGFCIRTGVQIPFDMERPFSWDAYNSWSRFGNPDYPEKYCHFSGEPSNGETTYNKPILGKNWRKAQEQHNL
jgi:hypothetical protein